MKTASMAIGLASITAVVAFKASSADINGDHFSLKVERSKIEGKVITVTPRNEEFRKDPSGRPYILTVRAASSLPLLRKGLFLKSERAEIPLDTNSPPPVSLNVFVDDFEFVIIEVASEKHWYEWKKIFYFQLDDFELIPVDAQKEKLPTGKSRTEQAAARQLDPVPSRKVFSDSER